MTNYDIIVKLLTACISSSDNGRSSPSFNTG